jgi:hypothetical protein
VVLTIEGLAWTVDSLRTHPIARPSLQPSPNPNPNPDSSPNPNANPGPNPNPHPRYLVAITWSILAAQGGITLEQPTHILQTFTVMCTMVIGLLVDAVLIGSIAQVLADQNAKQRAKVGPGTRAGA